MSPANSGRPLQIRGREFRWGKRTYIMAVVNASPDSFSGDGTADVAAAAAQAAAHLEAGADLLDIGGESTRPGSEPVQASLEGARVLPLIARIRESLPHAVISCDTYKPGLVAPAARAGADLINSVWGLAPGVLEAAVEAGLPIVIMHNKAEPVYEGGVVDEVLASLAAQAERAVRAGLSPNAVIVDPGIGFGKLPEHNLEILGALDRVVALGFPTLLGTSRKSTIGKITGRDVARRTYGTAATVALAIAAGIDLVRVHDTAAMRDVVRMSDAVVRGWRPENWPEVPA